MNILNLLIYNGGLTAHAYIQHKHEFKNFNLDGNLSSLDYTECAKKEILSKNFFSAPFERVNVLVATPQTAIVPADIFQPEMVDNYLLLSQLKGSSFRKNISTKLQAHILFATNEDFEFFIEKKYRNVHYFSSIFKWQELIQPANFKPHIFLFLYPYGADTLVFNYKKVLFCKHVEFFQIEDLIKVLHNFCQKNYIKLDDVALYYAGKIEPFEKNKTFQKTFPNSKILDENPVKNANFIFLN